MRPSDHTSPSRGRVPQPVPAGTCLCLTVVTVDRISQGRHLGSHGERGAASGLSEGGLHRCPAGGLPGRPMQGWGARSRVQPRPE